MSCWVWRRPCCCFGVWQVSGRKPARACLRGRRCCWDSSRRAWRRGLRISGYTTHLVARLQPLRCFQTVYLVMILLLGIWLGERVLRNKLWRWVAAMALFGVPMFLVQRQLYGASEHLRVAWHCSLGTRGCKRFVWARGNTPKEAMFAMEPHYIQAEGEDAQCFRAIAERDALAGLFQGRRRGLDHACADG